jgi:hypothetical protein
MHLTCVPLPPGKCLQYCTLANILDPVALPSQLIGSADRAPHTLTQRSARVQVGPRGQHLCYWLHHSVWASPTAPIGQCFLCLALITSDDTSARGAFNVTDVHGMCPALGVCFVYLISWSCFPVNHLEQKEI